MGCDIHQYVEAKQDGRWIEVKPLVKNPYYEKGSTWDFTANEFVPVSEARPRNYDAFAILGDVRNGRGFGGWATGDGFKPIAAHRGLPADVSRTVQAESDGWNGDGHSHNWLTLRELVADDAYWNQTTIQYGNDATYKVHASWYYSVLIPALVEWATSKDLSLDDVRLVFWFDN